MAHNRISLSNTVCYHPPNCGNYDKAICNSGLTLATKACEVFGDNFPSCTLNCIVLAALPCYIDCAIAANSWCRPSVWHTVLPLNRVKPGRAMQQLRRCFCGPQWRPRNCIKGAQLGLRVLEVWMPKANIVAQTDHNTIRCAWAKA